MELRERPLDPIVHASALAEGYTPLQAQIIARRLREPTLFREGSVRACIAPELGAIPSPDGFAGIELACERLTRAIDEGEHIAIGVDHDADGQTSATVFYRALVEIFGVDPRRLHVLCTWRLIEGYGISDRFVDRVLAHEPRPTLLLTGDQASADGPRITRLREAGVETLCTDHHAMPIEGPPVDAVACITPQHPNNRFPDPSIAGCMVALLCMAALRQRWINGGRLSATSTSLAPLLDYVALGTAADAVDLGASTTNRAVLRYGLERINRGLRPAWRALRRRAKLDPAQPVTTETLLFSWAPLTNAPGRMDEAMAGIRLMLAESDGQAEHWAKQLEAHNLERRAVERGMRDQALAIAKAQATKGRAGLAVFLPEGHAGVHGVVSSRIVEATGRPTICLSPKLPYDGLLTGSVRTVPGVDVKRALDAIHTTVDPGLLEAGYGGHSGAAGLKIPAAHLLRLEDAWDAAVRLQVDAATLVPHLWVDGPLPAAPTLEAVDQILALDPFGRGFPPPLWVQSAEILAATSMGDGTHLRYRLRLEGAGEEIIEAVHFNARSLDSVTGPPAVARHVRLVFQLSRKVWRGQAQCQLIVQHVAERADVRREAA